jgi:hypothetical protein
LLTGAATGFGVGVFVTTTTFEGVGVGFALLPTRRGRVGIGVGCTTACAERLIVRNSRNAKTEKLFFVIGIVPVRKAFASRQVRG